VIARTLLSSHHIFNVTSFFNYPKNSEKELQKTWRSFVQFEIFTALTYFKILNRLNNSTTTCLPPDVVIRNSHFANRWNLRVRAILTINNSYSPMLNAMVSLSNRNGLRSTWRTKWKFIHNLDDAGVQSVKTVDRRQSLCYRLHILCLFDRASLL